MESRASHALVGLSTLAILAVLCGFVYWFSTGSGANRIDVRVVFNHKVSGLGRGSSVLFNGLRIGEVTQIDLNPEDPRQIHAVIRITQSTPLRVDTTARIEGQGLAGIVAVQLLGGDPGSGVLTAQPGQSLPTIIAERSDDIFETVRNIATRADEALGGMEGLIKENSGAIGETLRSAESFTASLSENSGIEKFMQNVGSVADFIAPLTEKLGQFSEDVTQTIRTVDPQNVIAIVDDVERLATTIGGSSGDVAKAVKDAASIAEKLNRAADQVDGVLKGAQTFLNTAAGTEGQNAFSDVSEVARSIRVLADSLDKRTAEITAAITRFTSTGFRGIQSFTSDGRRIINGVGRTLRRVDQDPQSLIFGGKPPLPQYDGAR